MADVLREDKQRIDDLFTDEMLEVRPAFTFQAEMFSVSNIDKCTIAVVCFAMVCTSSKLVSEMFTLNHNFFCLFFFFLSPVV